MRLRATLALVAVVLGAGGCSYRSGFLVRDDIRRVAVPVFENKTFYRNLEVPLTKAVVDEIEKTTPYTIAQSDTADAVLSGVIVSYRTPVLRENAADVPVEVEIVLAADVVLRDAATGDILYRGTLRESENYAPEAGETELSTRPALFRRVARLIVEQAFERNW